MLYLFVKCTLTAEPRNSKKLSGNTKPKCFARRPPTSFLFYFRLLSVAAKLLMTSGSGVAFTNNTDCFADVAKDKSAV